MHLLPQEQDLSLIPIDLPIELSVQDSSYLELDPSYHNVEGVIGDALVFLLTHATHTLNYLETAKHICDELEIKPTDLSIQKKQFIASCIPYIRKYTQLDKENYEKVCAFLENRLGIKLQDLESLNFSVSPVVIFQKSADIINKVLTKQRILKKDLDDFLTTRVVLPHNPELGQVSKKIIKQNIIMMMAEFLADCSDKDTMIFFEGYCKERKLESYTSLKHVILRIYTRLFQELYEEDKNLESEKLLPKILELVQTVQDQIDPQDNKITTKHTALAEALYRIGDYYIKSNKPQLGIKSYLEAIVAYSDNASRFFEPAILNIRMLKKDEVRNYWLAKLIQVFPVAEDVKPDLLKWLTKRQIVVNSQDLKMLREYEEEKLCLQNRISMEISIVMDKLEMLDKASFYAYNNQVNEVCQIFKLLDANKRINRIFKHHIKVSCLHLLSENSDVHIASMIEQIDDEIVMNDTQHSILQASSYLNLFDNLKERVYLEKGLIHLLKVNELFVDQGYYREFLINLNLAFVIKILLVDSQSALNQKDFESASNLVCVANELFLKGRELDYIKETLLHINRYMSLMSSRLKVFGEKHIEFIRSNRLETDLTEFVNDPKILHKQYQESKSRAYVLQAENNLGEIDVVYSWRIRDQVYRSNDPNVFLIDPYQSIYAINDISGQEEELKQFDMALKKGFVGIRGDGIKYIKEKYKEILEVKISGDKRSVSDTILFNPEGAKLCVFSFVMNHKEVKTTRKKLTYRPCLSDNADNLLSEDRLSINWQGLCGFISRPLDY